MTYWLDLFTPETWGRFRQHGSSTSGFPAVMRKTARDVSVGDIFVCYMVRISRFCGILRVISTVFEDDEPIFADADDPYRVRFKVEPLVILELELAVPVTADEVWSRLSWTKGSGRGQRGWGMQFRRSLRTFSQVDGELLVSMLTEQRTAAKKYPLTDADNRALRVRPRIQTLSGPVTVEVPDESDEMDTHFAHPKTPAEDARESIRVQAHLVEIGARMGFRVWVPRSDRGRVEELAPSELRSALLDRLPLNYDEATLRTIEQIDVIWLKGRAMARAFEVEHTTAIYSGLLRMADLLALQPNMDIALHIVAPDEKRDKVFRELQRPVFALLERGPLARSCSFLSYDSVKELVSTPNLKYMRDSLLDEYTENPDAED